MKALPLSSKVVVIGGGVVGCSVAYHLAKFGWKDTVLLERDQLTSGTTWHAAGLVSQLGPSAAITKIRKYSLELYKQLEKEIDFSSGLKLNGALSIATTKGRWQELLRQATTAQLFDVNVEVLNIDQIKKIYPIINEKDILGGIFMPGDGQADPVGVTNLLAKAATNEGVKIFGTSSASIDLAENREEFARIVKKLKIQIPEYCVAKNYDEIINFSEVAKFPVLVRPSYVLGGRAMQIVYNKEQLVDYVFRSAEATNDHPILIDQFIENAFEFDVDALCDGEEVFIAGIMQHIEEAGVHSGDSSCVLPPYDMSATIKKDIIEMTTKLALELKVVGLINLQFAVKGDKAYVLEVNPRSSRTVPFVSKYSNVPLANIAAQLSVGKKLKDFNLKENNLKHIAVKKAVLPFKKFKDEKVFLGPEMKSTGEVMGIDNESGIAFLKAMQSDGYTVPNEGTAFISISDIDKKRALPIIKDLLLLNFNIIATKGTAKFLIENGIDCTSVFKVGEGRPNVVDEILNDNIQLVINTPIGEKSRYDEEAIGKTSVMKNVLTITTLSGAKAAIAAMSNLDQVRVKPLQEYFK
jgi:carbamoyl-phosphate synthase large subunit